MWLLWSNFAATRTIINANNDSIGTNGTDGLISLVDTVSMYFMWIGIFVLAYFMLYFLWKLITGIRFKKNER